ncbi:MAG: hypothetical protein R3268_10110 [Acidiferrobacterales bacterium]|nr:hypothetical protein [Acidiferrobacterales bacterium]
MAQKMQYDRGTLLSIFKTDRAEDLVALAVALAIVVLVVLFVPR